MSVPSCNSGHFQLVERCVIIRLLRNTRSRAKKKCAKWYGLEFGDEVKLDVPLKESAPRVPPPHGDHIFYYPQVDTLAKLSEGKNWNFADIRPDAVVFAPCQHAHQVNCLRLTLI